MSGPGDGPKAVTLAAPTDGEKEGESKGTKKEDKKKKEQKKELSEEDQKKKEELELLVKRAMDPDDGVMTLALQTMVTELKTAAFVKLSEQLEKRVPVGTDTFPCFAYCSAMPMSE